MRVEHEPGSSSGDVRRVASRTFVAALRRRLAAPATRAPRRLLRASAVPVESVATGLRQARAEMDGRAQLRLDAAVPSERAAEGRKEDVRTAAQREATPSAPGPSRGEVAPALQAHRQEAMPPCELPRSLPPSPGRPAAPAARAGMEAVLALVERVEHLLRAGQPSLAFTLAGRHGQRVQLERLGPGEVGIRLEGGAFGRAEAERLAAELDGRGLHLARLQWLSPPPPRRVGR